MIFAIRISIRIAKFWGCVESRAGAEKSAEFSCSIDTQKAARAKGPRLDAKTGSLTPGKEADIIILDATASNVAPLNRFPARSSR
jgi:cytosine/adenosine deaminase-related metal-dependent hydrolase